MDATPLVSQVTVGMLVTFVLQWAKRSPYVPFLQAHQKRLHFYLSGALALVSSLGVAYTWDATAGTLVITGLSWATMGPAVWAWVQQWAIQQGVYQGVVQRSQMRAKEVVILDRGASAEDVQRAVTDAVERVFAAQTEGATS